MVDRGLGMSVAGWRGAATAGRLSIKHTNNRFSKMTRTFK